MGDRVERCLMGDGVGECLMSDGVGVVGWSWEGSWLH